MDTFYLHHNPICLCTTINYQPSGSIPKASNNCKQIYFWFYIYTSHFYFTLIKKKKKKKKKKFRWTSNMKHNKKNVIFGNMMAYSDRTLHQNKWHISAKIWYSWGSSYLNPCECQGLTVLLLSLFSKISGRPNTHKQVYTVFKVFFTLG